MDWNSLAKDKMWNGSGLYGIIGVISTSTPDISLDNYLLYLSFMISNSQRI